MLTSCSQASKLIKPAHHAAQRQHIHVTIDVYFQPNNLEARTLPCGVGTAESEWRSYRLQACSMCLFITVLQSTAAKEHKTHQHTTKDGACLLASPVPFGVVK